MTPLPSLDEIIEAQKLVYSLMHATPQISWPLLNQRLRAEVWVKHENHTPIGAFKARTAIVYAAEVFKNSNGIKGLRGRSSASIMRPGVDFTRRVIGLPSLSTVL